jgi:hypothetical protein
MERVPVAREPVEATGGLVGRHALRTRDVQARASRTQGSGKDRGGRAEGPALKLSTIIIQRAYRDSVFRRMIFNSACTLQSAVKQFLSRITFCKVRRGVLRTQSLKRGQILRHMRSKELLARALCIERANAYAKAAPWLKLGNRTRVALDILLKSKSLSEVMDAV